MADIIEFDTKNRLAVYRVGKDFGSVQVTPGVIEETVIHELLHLLKHEMLEAAIEDKDYSDRVQGHEHGVIAVLTPLLRRVYGVLSTYGRCATASIDPSLLSKFSLR